MVFDLVYLLNHSTSSELIAIVVVETADNLQIAENLWFNFNLHILLLCMSSKLAPVIHPTIIMEVI